MADMSIDEQITQVKMMIAGLELTASAVKCDLIDEKLFLGTSTKEGDLCRLRRWAAYLLAVLLCEFSPEGDCCEIAEADYCSSWEQCPD